MQLKYNSATGKPVAPELNKYMKEKIKSKYAIPCVMTDDGELDVEEVFFITMNTRDENEAIRLASCVCGKRQAPNSLVIINERGQIFPVY